MLVVHFKICDYFWPFDYSLDRYSSIIHAGLRLDACALHCYLFKIGVKSSAICRCGFHNETKASFFLYYPLYAAPRENLLSGAAHIVSYVQWLRFSDSQNVDLFLFGFSRLSNEGNFEIFFHVQQFMKESKCFCFLC